MRPVLALLALLLLAVAAFALQNEDPVTVRFLVWQAHSSVAAVILVSAFTGVAIAGLLAVLARLRRSRRARGASPPERAPAVRGPAPPSVGPPSRSGH